MKFNKQSATYSLIVLVIIVTSFWWRHSVVFNNNPLNKIQDDKQLNDEDIKKLRNVDISLLKSYCKSLNDLSKKIIYPISLNLNVNKEIICNMVKEKKENKNDKYKNY